MVNSLMNCAKWDKIYLLCNEFSYDNFESKKENCIKLKFDEKKIEDSLKKLSDFFKNEVKDFEVALNLTSGSGMEHMMVTSSILKAGLGVRFVYCDNNELKEFELLEEDYSKVNEDF